MAVNDSICECKFVCLNRWCIVIAGTYKSHYTHTPSGRELNILQQN